MAETEFGMATIVYEDPNEGTVEETVNNEHIAYFQDHWIIKTNEHDEGHDVVRRIPAQRVYYVERNVEAFEEEVRTLRNQFQSIADGIGLQVQTLRDRVETVTEDLQTGLLGGPERPEDTDSGVRYIDIEEGDSESDTDDEREE